MSDFFLISEIYLSLHNKVVYELKDLAIRDSTKTI